MIIVDHPHPSLSLRGRGIIQRFSLPWREGVRGRGSFLKAVPFRARDFTGDYVLDYNLGEEDATERVYKHGAGQD